MMVNECRFFSRFILVTFLITACGAISSVGHEEPKPVSKDVIYQDVAWVKYDAGIFDLAEEEGKLVLIYLDSRWCPSCSMMRAHFAHPDVMRYVNDNFVPVMTGDEGETVKESFNLRSYPSVVVFTSRGQRVITLDGYVSRKVLLDALTYAVHVTEGER
jgi:thioredoxin-related protein